MVILSNKRYKEILDRIVSLETRSIRTEMKMNEIREIKANERKAVLNSEIVDEWLNGKSNAK